MYTRYGSAYRPKAAERPGEAGRREAATWVARRLAWEHVIERLAEPHEDEPHETAPANGAPQAAGRHRRRRVARLLLACFLGAMIPGVLAADGFVLSQQNVTTPLSLDDALARFRTPTPSGAGGRPALVSPAPASSRSGRAPASPGPAPEHRGGGAPSRSLGPPPEGVYAYGTRGGESISLTGARHEYPPETYATVRRGSGCGWVFEHRIVEEHVERSTLCSARAELLLLGETVTVTFFGQRNTSDWRCEPPQVVARPADASGAVRTSRCHGEDGETSSRISSLGVERLRIGARSVDALHVLIESVVSGRAEGTARTEQWLDPGTGLLLRSVRHVETSAREFGATVTYREDATFELTSLASRS